MQNNLQTYQKINTISAIQKLSDIKDIYSYPPPLTFIHRGKPVFLGFCPFHTINHTHPKRDLMFSLALPHSSRVGTEHFMWQNTSFPLRNTPFYIFKYSVPTREQYLLHQQTHHPHTGILYSTLLNAHPTQIIKLLTYLKQ